MQLQPSAFLRAAILLALSVMLALITASAQDSALDLETIDRQLAELEDDETVRDEVRNEISDVLSQAREEITEAAERADRTDAYVETAQNSTETISEIRESLQAVLENRDEPVVPETSDALRSRLNTLESEQAVRARQRAELQDLQTEMGQRSSVIAEEAAEFRRSLEEFVDAQASANANDGSFLARARETLLEARILNRRAGIADFQRELVSLPDRQSINQAEIALLDARIDAANSEIGIIQTRLSDVRMDRADAALSRALGDRSNAQDLSEPILAMADENVELASTLAEMANNALAIDQDIRLTTQRAQLIRQQSETVDRIIATGRVTEEAGALLRQLRGNLPNIQALRSEINNAVEMRASTQLNLILWQDRLRSVRQQAPPSVPREIVDQEPDDAAGDILDEVPLEEGIRDHRLGLLSDLIEAGQAQSDRLNEKEVRLGETLREAQSLRNTLDRRLLWLPSNVSPLRNWLPSVLSSFEWITSPELSVSVWENYRDALGQSPLLIALTALLFCIAIYARRHLRESLIDLNGAVGKIARDKYSTTPAALLVSLGLASPIPILLVGLSLPIFLFDSQSVALKAFGAGVTSLAGLLLLIRIAAIISAEDSLLSTHFNWSSRALAAIRSVPTWLLIVLCVLGSIVIAALVSGRADTQDGIGSLAFIFASALFSLLGYKTFGLERGVVRQIVSEDVGNGPLFLGFFTFAIAPLIVGALPLLGYFDTAVALQSRVLASATLLFVAALLFGILNRILLIAQRRLALRRAIERRERKAAERAEREQLGEGDDEEEFIEPSATTEELQRERQLISSQTERLLFYVFGIGILIGLFGIWATVLPALGVANDITLWTGVDTIDGVRTARPVTLWNLFLFFAFNIGGVFAAYNIRGILEVGVFQRLHLSAGSRYAIQTIIGYFFVGAGIIAGFLQLGVDWSRLQWIIAALGVGLGFGLQEIVANFISGLIILFERPVRVGDTVNIGELEGDVTNIAIRATTVRDFDNREVLLPNKSIITENVTNWTLRDSVVRIIINIGVAYGSDIEAVREILLRIADDENDVLETPEPRAFFMNHGDSSLDFELRVFISNPRKRFRVRDELNTAINKAFNEAGIEIPFPQRDLHVRSQ